MRFGQHTPCQGRHWLRVRAPFMGPRGSSRQLEAGGSLRGWRHGGGGIQVGLGDCHLQRVSATAEMRLMLAEAGEASSATRLQLVVGPSFWRKLSQSAMSGRRIQKITGSKRNFRHPDQKQIIYRIKNKLSCLGVPKRCNFHNFSGNSARILRLQLKNRHFPIQAQYAKVTLAAPVRKSQLFRHKRSSLNESSIG